MQDRLPVMFRRLPGALLYAPGVQRLPLYRCRRNDSVWYVLSGRARRHSSHQTILEVSPAHDLDRLWVHDRTSSTVQSLLTATPGPICLSGLVAGSFARDLGTLIFTQGVMYGTGFILFYYPILSMVNEYWITRRGFAYGLLCSASGVSGAALPFAMEKLLQKYGYPTTLRAVAIGLFAITGPLIPLLNSRLPETGAGAPARTDWSFLQSHLFWTYSLSNLAMGMGYFFPSLYIPSYALACGMSSTQGALLLALMAVSQVFGQLTFGYLSDRRVTINLLAGSSTVVAAVAVYTFWGLARSFNILVAFALIYGFFGAGYTALWVRSSTLMFRLATVSHTNLLIFHLGPNGYSNQQRSYRFLRSFWIT